LSKEIDLFDGTEFRRRLPLLDLFDAIIDTTYTGIPMPDPCAPIVCAPIDGAAAASRPCGRFDVTGEAQSYRFALQKAGLSFNTL